MDALSSGMATDLGTQVVLVTGGTGFLGSAVCKAFAEVGATVVAVYLVDEELPYFRRTLGTLAERVECEKADVTEPGEVDRVVAEVRRRHNRIDVLVNTVGGYMSGRVEDASEEDLDRAFALNLKSTFLACKAVIPVMRKQERGKIVSVSSRTALRGEEESFLYAASKAGVNRLTESLAEELMPSNIQVNCVMPSVMDTPANREWMSEEAIGRAVGTDEVARVIRWMCTEEAKAMTGAAIPIYGRA